MLRKILLYIFLLATAMARADDGAAPRRMAYPGGRCYMMRLWLKDKAQNDCTLDHPETFLSKKALDRRRRQGIVPDSTDLPVSSHYLRQLTTASSFVVSKSKWNNSVVVRSKSMQTLKALSRLPFVSDSRLVWRSPDSIEVARPRMNFRKEFNRWGDVSDETYGITAEQTMLLHGEALHARGARGRGKTIAVLDGGFMNVDRIPAFRSVNIAGTADLVFPKKDIYKEVDHGTKVLSTMAVAVPGTFVGTAPEAAYWLIRCEDDETEQLVEEDYWAAAAEYADSVGADIITSSLGYHGFDHKDMGHKYRDLDGHATLISHTASLLASKGIIFVCSAGNDGMSAWKKINVPADADNILAVGAVTPEGTNAAFSSIGPTADGRPKPDIMALGSPAAVITGRGTILKDIGTSFAAPQVAGLVACLWQLYPDVTALDLIRHILLTGNNHSSPDNINGYGIPDFSVRVK